MRVNENYWQSRTGSCPTRRLVHGTIEKLGISECPFNNLPEKKGRFAVAQSALGEPEIRCEVAFNEWGGQPMIKCSVAAHHAAVAAEQYQERRALKNIGVAVAFFGSAHPGKPSFAPPAADCGQLCF